MKRERCTCKNFEKVALEGGSIFNEAMYTCKCSVGKTFNKCENVLHIQALDYRAATFEALQELGRAQRDAEWILELAPRLLEVCGTQLMLEEDQPSHMPRDISALEKLHDSRRNTSLHGMFTTRASKSANTTGWSRTPRCRSVEKAIALCPSTNHDIDPLHIEATTTSSILSPGSPKKSAGNCSAHLPLH